MRPLPEWAEPGAHEVAPGVFRIPLPLPDRGLRAVNVYALTDGERVTLIDGGWATEESLELLAHALDSIGYGLEHVTQFLVTHMHRDHYTQAVTVRRTYGTPIVVGAGERAGFEWLDEERLGRPYGQFAQLDRAGAPDVVARLMQMPEDDSVDAKTFERPDRWLDGSTDIAVGERSLRGIPTPGHTRGHFVFRDHAGGLLFAGDHVLPHITPSIGFEAPPSESPLADYLDSLLLVRTLPDTRLLPAHGPVTESVHARVDELLDHHTTRLDATLAAVHGGAQTAREVAGLLGWTRRETHLDELSPYNQMLAVLETQAHLRVLVERGQLRTGEPGGVLHYEIS